jgi:group I intron endonuclease
LYIEQINKMSSVSNKKRSHSDSGSSSDKRQRLSSDDSDILETKESEALVEQVDGDDTKCRTGCIYLITNPINGKVYVGQSIEYKTRMKTHEDSGKNPKFYLGYAIRKYGWENFTKEILIDDVPEEDLNNLEINYIAFYNSFGPGGYNLTKGGGGASGYKFTNEQRMAKSKSITKNHSVQGGGCISFDSRAKKWKASGYHASGGKRIGEYFTKDKAIEALTLYNETGQCIPSDMRKRIPGSGCVFYFNRSKRWKAIVSERTGKKLIGQYFTEEKAIAALKLYNGTGARMPSDVTMRRRGTGCILEFLTKTKGKTYKGQIKIKNKTHCTKTYGSRKKAKFELEKLRSKFL